MRGRPPSEAMAKLWVTPLRTPRRPVSSEARDGEHVDAAEWKSTNLQNEKTLQLTTPCVLSHCPGPPCCPAHSPFCSGDEGREWEMKVPAGMDGSAPQGTRLWPPSPCTQTHTNEIPSPASPTGLNSPVLQDRVTKDAWRGQGRGTVITLFLRQPTGPNAGSPSSLPSWRPDRPSPHHPPG